MSNHEAHTVKLQRVLRAPAERIYRAFLEPLAMCKWLPPYGFVAEVQHSDVRVGGSYRMSFTNFGTGQSHSFGGTYLELVPNQRICYTDRFDDPNLPGEMQADISLRAVVCGTELLITQKNIPPQIPVEMCYLGWQESLQQLAQLVEPQIP
ncbi:MAG: SRPBCC family protein [Oligoflexia bacterium]|nr:SRPBCC family protein [Oligoflexia bacterium]